MACNCGCERRDRTPEETAGDREQEKRDTDRRIEELERRVQELEASLS